MAHKVFICHSSKDKPVADAACAALEAKRIPCWIAPRDILAGVEYGEAIIEAISSCQIVLLIFSHAANGSPQVRREVERAVSKEKIIVPFRIENVMPSNAMEFALSNTHWLDALTPPLERALSELCETISRLIQRQQPVPAPEPVFESVARQPEVKAVAPAAANAPKQNAGSRGFPGWAWGVLGVLALVTVFAVGRSFAPRSQPATSTETVAQPVTESAESPAASPNTAQSRSVAPNRLEPTSTSASSPPAPKADLAALDQQADALYKQKRFSEAAPLYEKLCNSGKANDCGRLAAMYGNGVDLPADTTRSLEFTTKACNGGLADDCLALGLDYQGVQGIPQNYPLAFAFYTKACNACNDLGCSYANQMRQSGKVAAASATNLYRPSSCGKARTLDDDLNDMDKTLSGK
jgi:hypothetical protein